MYLVFLLALIAPSNWHVSIPESAKTSVILEFNSGTSLDYPVCLTISGHDPSQRLLSKLRAKDRYFFPLSKCEKTKFYLFAPNGKTAWRVAVKDFHRQDINIATVKYIETNGGPLGGAAWRVLLLRFNGKWIVIGKYMLWIS